MENSNHNMKNNDFSKFYFLASQNLQKKSLISPVCCLPTSVLALILFILICYNSFTLFYFTPVFSIENTQEIDQNLPTSYSQFSPLETLFSVNEETLKSERVFNYPTLEDEPRVFSKRVRRFTKITPKKLQNTHQSKEVLKNPPLKAQSLSFSERVRRFLVKNSCKVPFFMTWISSLESFDDREKFTIESLFKFHPNACLIIVSDSMDSNRGTQILEPFLRLNFKVMAVSPDFGYVFKNTLADDWYKQLEKGQIRPGEISIGQNLSNLLRLALLYKYGGIYMDTDFIVLKRLDTLRNSIGAQTIDPKTKKWSRLNNALMVFDKNHPLLSKFIEEFCLTFNGNKWGYNGPYLVSRVVERVTNNGSMGLGGGGASEFTILPPTAFYVVDWAKIGDLFKQPRDEDHLRWVNGKLKHIEGGSYAVHLWNRRSRGLKVEDGSIISHLKKKSCVFCNSSRASL